MKTRTFRITMLGLGWMALFLILLPARSDACEGCGCPAKAGKDAPAFFDAQGGGCPYAKALQEGSCPGGSNCPAAVAHEGDRGQPCADCPCKKDGSCPCKDGKACAECKDCPCKKDGRCQCPHGGQCPHHSKKP